MIICAIDPGTEQSACLLYDPERGVVPDFAWITPNEALVVALPELRSRASVLVIEEMECYGMPVGKEVLKTAVWSGRFIQAWVGEFHIGKYVEMPRREVKLHLCQSMRAKDANVRQALIDRFGPGKEKAIGKKAAPGPLLGITSHLWSALALAVTLAETNS